MNPPGAPGFIPPYGYAPMPGVPGMMPMPPGGLAPVFMPPGMIPPQPVLIPGVGAYPPVGAYVPPQLVPRVPPFGAPPMHRIVPVPPKGVPQSSNPASLAAAASLAQQAAASLRAEEKIMTCFVGNIPSSVENDFMKKILECCGKVVSWKRVSDPISNQPKKFGFCEFEGPEPVLRALRLLKGLKVDGSELAISVEDKTKLQLDTYERRRGGRNLSSSGGEPSEEAEDAKMKQDVDKLIESRVSGEWQSDESNTQPVQQAGEKMVSKGIRAFREKQIQKEGDKKKFDKIETPTMTEEEKIEREREREKRDKERERNKKREERDRERKAEERRIQQDEKEYRRREEQWEDRERDKERRRDQDRNHKEVERERQDRDRLASDIDSEEDRHRRDKARDRRRREREDEVRQDTEDRNREQKEIDEMEKIQRRKEVELKLQKERENLLISGLTEATQQQQSRLAAAAAAAASIVAAAPVRERERERERETYHQPEQSPPSSSSLSDGRVASVSFGLKPAATKKKPVSLTAAGFEVADDGDEWVPKRQRELIRLDDDSQSKGPDLQSLAAKVPTEREEIFSYPINWAAIEEGKIIEKKIKPWITKKMTELIGEEEPSLIEFMLKKMNKQGLPSEILEQLAFVLEEEAEPFVLKLWRMLIFQSIHASQGTPAK